MKMRKVTEKAIIIEFELLLLTLLPKCHIIVSNLIRYIIKGGNL